MRRRSPFLFVLLAFAPASGRAQDVPPSYFAFEPGARWEYERVECRADAARERPAVRRTEASAERGAQGKAEEQLVNQPPPTLHLVTLGYERWILRHREEGAEGAVSVFQVEHLDADRVVLATAECAVEERRRGPKGWDLWHTYVRRSGDCRLPGWALPSEAVVDRTMADSPNFTPLLIGGEVYTFDELSLNCHHGQVRGSCWIMAPDIGLVATTWFEWGEGALRGTALALTSAEVNGRRFGTPTTEGPAPGLAAQEGADGLPTVFALEAVYPNPFQRALTLRLALPLDEDVRVELFDALGRLIERRDLGEQSRGRPEVRLEGGGLAAGLYIVRVSTASGASATQRVVRAE